MHAAGYLCHIRAALGGVREMKSRLIAADPFHPVEAEAHHRSRIDRSSERAERVERHPDLSEPAR